MFKRRLNRQTVTRLVSESTYPIATVDLEHVAFTMTDDSIAILAAGINLEVYFDDAMAVEWEEE